MVSIQLEEGVAGQEAKLKWSTSCPCSYSVASATATDHDVNPNSFLQVSLGCPCLLLLVSTHVIVNDTCGFQLGAMYVEHVLSIFITVTSVIVDC